MKGKRDRHHSLTFSMPLGQSPLISNFAQSETNTEMLEQKLGFFANRLQLSM
jgi:hypothetical protein